MNSEGNQYLLKEKKNIAFSRRILFCLIVFMQILLYLTRSFLKSKQRLGLQMKTVHKPLTILNVLVAKLV
jgi:hypothetical protein